VYWRDSVTIWLEQADDTARISVSDATGAVIEGESTQEDGVVRFTPSNGFTPDQEHVATIEWCRGSHDIPFTTSELGLPLEVPFWDQGYALDLGDANWIQPEGMEFLMGDMFDLVMLIGMGEIGFGIDVWGANTLPGSLEQDLCQPTMDLMQSDPFLLPFFQFGGGSQAMYFGGSEIVLSEFSGSGTIAPDASYFGGIEVSFLMDLRHVSGEFAEMLEESLGFDLSNTEQVCQGLELMGLSCEVCPTDGENACLRVALDGMSVMQSGLPSKQVPVAFCDPGCATRDEHPECEE
jgi:hypothetical protein